MGKVSITEEQYDELNKYFILREHLGESYNHLVRVMGYVSRNEEANIKRIIDYLEWLHKDNSLRLHGMIEEEMEI